MNERAAGSDDAWTAAGAADVEVDPASLERLNPRVQLLWLARAGLGAAVIGAVAGGIAWYLDEPALLIGPGLFLAIGALGAVHTVLRYRIWGFVVRDDSIYLRRGVIVRVQTVVPYARIQHVDTSRSPFERLVGLASSVIYTAGSRGADVRIPGLQPGRARELQERLKDLANVSGGDDAV